MMRRRLMIIGVSAAAITVVSLVSTAKFAPKLVWNASASAPIGLYRIENREPDSGDFVLIAPSEIAAKLIEERRYLPPDIPLIKRIAALFGDEICRESETIFINKVRVAEAQNVDSLGREMPGWSGCFTLQNDEIFLLNDHESSLDGRYFGATKMSDVIGVAIPVLVEEQDR